MVSLKNLVVTYAALAVMSLLCTSATKNRSNVPNSVHFSLHAMSQYLMKSTSRSTRLPGYTTQPTRPRHVRITLPRITTNEHPAYTAPRGDLNDPVHSNLWTSSQAKLSSRLDGLSPSNAAQRTAPSSRDRVSISSQLSLDFTLLYRQQVL